MQTLEVPLASLVRLERRALTQGIRVMIALQECTLLAAPALVLSVVAGQSLTLICRPAIPAPKASTPLLGIQLAPPARREPTQGLGPALAAFVARGR